MAHFHEHEMLAECAEDLQLCRGCMYEDDCPVYGDVTDCSCPRREKIEKLFAELCEGLNRMVETVVIEGEPYLITDIGMRMLTPRELFNAQGFPRDYIIAPIYNGKPLTKTAQVRMCGNSVCPPVAAAIISANCGETALMF